MRATDLSSRIDLEQSRKQAKELLRSLRAGDPETLDQVRWNHPRLHGRSDDEIRVGRFVLADAQLVIARLHGFDGWTELRAHIEALRRADPAVERFERAADAIVAGDAAELETLLRRHPHLLRERSTRAHRAPLLHFVSANGVEGYRQQSPPNAVQVARALLDAGAEVDATSEAYGGGWATLGLVATSTPPQLAGVQIPLLDLLLDRGAAIDGVHPTVGSVRGALLNDCPEAARALAARGAALDVVTAAGVADVETVRRLAPGARKSQLDRAFLCAAAFGEIETLAWLLDQGVDVAASDGMTALHRAAGRGRLDMVDLLVARGAPLEKRNAWGGTVLGSTLWFVRNGDTARRTPADYPAVLDRLIAAGARVDVHPAMRTDIEAVYRRAGRAAPWERSIP